MKNKEFLEILAELEHNQWVHWTQNIVNFEKISEDTQDKWAGLWRPYDNLKEEDKEKDRKFARLVIKEFKNLVNGMSCSEKETSLNFKVRLINILNKEIKK